MIRESFRERINLGAEIGTSALDIKIEGNYTTDPYMANLATVWPDNTVKDTDEHFEEPSPDQLMEGYPGGIGNAAHYAIAPVLRATINETTYLSEQEKEALRVTEWAILTWLGNDNVGNIWERKIDNGIDQRLIRKHPEYPSGLSVVHIQAEAFATEKVPTGERAIYYRAGASGEMVFTQKDVSALKDRNPFNINYSYPGLDKNDGDTIALFVKELQAKCPCVTMDTHGPTELNHIEKALSSIDMFNSNFDNAAKVFLEDEDNKAKESNTTPKTRMELYQKMGEKIKTFYISAENSVKERTRMFTITDRHGTYLIFYNHLTKKIHSAYIHSPAASISAKDKTGAGDVRFALQRLYVAILAPNKWQDGWFSWQDAETAVNVGQIGTALFIQGKETQHLEGVSLYTLQMAAKSKEEYIDLQSLKKKLVPETTK